VLGYAFQQLAIMEALLVRLSDDVQVLPCDRFLIGVIHSKRLTALLVYINEFEISNLKG